MFLDHFKFTQFATSLYTTALYRTREEKRRFGCSSFIHSRTSFLFLVYVNDLPVCIGSDSTTVSVFADDTNWLTDDPTLVTTTLNTIGINDDISETVDLNIFKIDMMKLNTSKLTIISITRKQTSCANLLFELWNDEMYWFWATACDLVGLWYD
jgi:hypothetical protein